MGFGGFWQNVRDLISPPKLPPLQTTSQPIDVPDIWSKNTQFTRVEALSIAFHVMVLALILAPFLSRISSPGTAKANNSVNITQVSLYTPKLPSSAKKAGGGGGANDVAPVSRGRAPKFSYTQIARPMVQCHQSKIPGDAHGIG